MASLVRPSTKLVQTRIRGLVTGSPGIHVRRIAMLTGLSWNTCLYHLRLLERGGDLVSRKVQGRICWFDCRNGAVPGKEGLILLRNTENLRLVRAILDEPGRNQLQLARSLGLAASVVHRRVTRMEQAGLILRHRTMRSVHVFPAQGLVEAADMVGVPADVVARAVPEPEDLEETRRHASPADSSPPVVAARQIVSAPESGDHSILADAFN